MRMMLNGLSLMVGLLACVAAFGKDGEDLLLYCDFNGSVNATRAIGDKIGECAIPPRFQGGVQGQALLIGGKISGKQTIASGLPVVEKKGRNCYYSPEKNFDVEKGTISFWLKPLDWDGSTSGFNVFFQTKFGENNFLVYKYFSGERIQFWRGHGKNRTLVKYEIGGWEAGEWHHVAVTWSPTEVKMFVNGKMVCVRRVKFPFIDVTPVEPLSVGPGNAWEKGYVGESLIDEFRVHGRPLSQREIVELYERYGGDVRKDAGLITIGTKTPTLDGVIKGYEYSFAGTGFSNPSTGLISHRQSRYFLSYDRNSLYVGLTSKLSTPKNAENGADSASKARMELFVEPPDQPVRRFVLTPDGAVAEKTSAGEKQSVDGVKVESAVSDGTWTIEAAIPFKTFGAGSAPNDRRWRVNIGRVFASPTETTSVAPVVGKLSDAGNFMTLAFRPNAPSIRIADMYDLNRDLAAYDIGVESKNPDAKIVWTHTSDMTYKHGMKTLSRTLFDDGKSTPFIAPPSWKLHDFALTNMKIIETLDGKTIPLFQEAFIYEKRTPMRTEFFYTHDRKQLSVWARRQADGQIRVRFLRPDKTLAWSVSRDIPEGVTFFNTVFDLDFSKLPPDDYTVKIDHVAPDGTVTETWEQAYRVPSVDSPILRKYVDPEAGTVPKPWTPVEVDGAVVKTWGREYDFSKGILFSSLKSQGRDLLAAPAFLALDGDPLSLNGASISVPVSRDDMAAVIEKNADLGELVVNSRIKTHFDGYCEVKMVLAPKGGKRQIRSLSLDVPLVGEAATLVRDNKLSFLIGSKSGAVGDYWCQSMGSNPFFWVGNEDVGFNWLAPSLDAWHVENNAKNIEIIRKADVATLRFNLVDHPLTLTGPRTFEFAFILTPSRPLDRKILRKRFFKDWWIYVQPWKYFSVTDYDDANRDVFKRYSKGVDEVFVYLGRELTSPFAPDWAFWEEEWRPGEIPNTEYAQQRIKYTSGDITSETFRNYVQHTRAEFFEKAKTPLAPKAINYYFDTGAGTPRNIDFTRELTLNVYRMIKRTRPDAKIVTHQGWPRMMPTQHFCETIIGGEGVEGPVAAKGSYYDILTPDMFRATFLPGTWGMKTGFINMLVRAAILSPEKFARFAEDPEAQRATRHAFGYCLVHDVDMFAKREGIRDVRGIVWDAQDQLGWDEDVVFHPYWKKDSGVTLVNPESDRILASAYTKDGKLMLAVLNDTDQTQDVKLNLDLNKLGVKPGMKGRDAFVKDKSYVLGETWEDSIPPREFRLVSWPETKTEISEAAK